MAKTKKGSTVVIAVIVLIVAIAAGSFGWILAQKKTNQPLSEFAVDSQKQSVQSTENQKQSDNEIDATVSVPASWVVYSDAKYGFEMKLPAKLEKMSFGGEVAVEGKKYKTIQLNNTGENPPLNGLIINIVKGYNNVSVDPWGNSAYATPTMKLNGITWNVFYNAAQPLLGCEHVSFQTMMPNGADMLVVNQADNNKCPGNPAKSASVDFLKQVISSFRFTSSNQVELESSVMAAVETQKRVENWDKKISVVALDPTQNAAKGKWWAKDAWDWIAWKQADGKWKVLVSNDGFKCAELNLLPKQFDTFFQDTIYMQGKKYCS